ncbi:MAG: hypothetical protein HQK51_18150 [Oligoflexia bacterium]|nr:hypothetical protein [Oligoflexia bacterium]
MLKVLTVTFFALSLSSCAFLSPLDQKTIDELSTCQIPIEQARKNLLLNGWAIQHETATDFSTDYKLRKKGAEDSYQFIAVAIDKSTIKFNLKVIITKAKFNLMNGTEQIISPAESVSYTPQNQSILKEMKNYICSL